MRSGSPGSSQPPSRTAPPSNAERTSDGSAWGKRAAALVIGAFAASLLWTALTHHPVGDYSAESDFYGGYAEGARLVQQGHWEPRRYTVVGPGYETALAIAGRAAPDLFTAAKLLSVAAAVGALLLWYVLVARRAGSLAGLWVAGFIAVNPSFFRYGYSATTDMLAMFLQTACGFAMLGTRRRWAPALAGVLAALAALTRYSSLYLLPGAWACYGTPIASAGSRRGASLAWFTAGFLVVLGPWLAHSMASGVVPGETLARGYGFYGDAGHPRDIQDLVREPEKPEPTHPGLREVVLRHPATFVAGLLGMIPDHLVLDARDLLGWPAAAALALGFVLLLRAGRWKLLLFPWCLGALCFALLLLAFHSERYSLPLVAYYATAAAGFAGTSARWSRGLTLAARSIGLAAIALSCVAAVRVQQKVFREAPTEVPADGRSLAEVAPSGSRVVARKGHIGYYSGRDVVPFPRFLTLRALADHARAGRADFLYFSWYDTQVRPELAFLLDTTSAVPGLSLVHVSRDKPSVLYRIGPEFGRAPEWMADDFQRSVHLARARVWVAGDSAGAREHVVLAVDALVHRQWAEARRHAWVARTASPTDAMAWAIEGEALRELGRNDEARRAYDRAMALDPSDPSPRIGLGRIESMSGNRERAVSLWRSAAAVTDDEGVLEEISGLLAGVADTAGVRNVQRAIARMTTTRANPSPGAARTVSDKPRPGD
jgi:tetratricopeptide (TPR) repeat protein